MPEPLLLSIGLPADPSRARLEDPGEDWQEALSHDFLL